MRAIHTTIKTIAPLAAIVALMAIPSVASASAMYWGEHDYDPLGGTPTSEDVVTVDVSGTLEVDIYYGYARSATCDVVGEVRLYNDWDNPSGSPATQQIVDLAPAGTVANSCTGNAMGWCQVSGVSYDGPWTGSTHGTAPHMATSTFSDVSISLGFAPCGLSSLTVGTLGEASPSVYPYSNGSLQGDCIEGFEIYDATLWGENPLSVPSQVTGALEFDLDSLEGLSTDHGGPCVTLNTQ